MDEIKEMIYRQDTWTLAKKTRQQVDIIIIETNKMATQKVEKEEEEDRREDHRDEIHNIHRNMTTWTSNGRTLSQMMMTMMMMMNNFDLTL